MQLAKINQNCLFLSMNHKKIKKVVKRRPRNLTLPKMWPYVVSVRECRLNLGDLGARRLEKYILHLRGLFENPNAWEQVWHWPRQHIFRCCSIVFLDFFIFLAYIGFPCRQLHASDWIEFHSRPFFSVFLLNCFKT